MNLLCPNCQRMITVPDENAGQTMKCPLCAGSFTAPSLPGSMGTPASEASPRASSLNPTPGVSSRYDQGASASAPSKGEGADPFASEISSPLTGDYRRRYTIWISPRVVPWIAPVGLVLIFLLFFFYWRSLPTVVEAANLDIEPSRRGWTELFSNGWLILYFLFYLVVLVMTIGSLLLDLQVVVPPPQLKPMLPWRSAIIGGLALVAFLLLILGSAGEDFPSFWFGLTAWAHFAVLIGLALDYWLEYRGPNCPLPKIDIGW